MTSTRGLKTLAAIAILATTPGIAPAEYKAVTPRKPADGEIAVTTPGTYAEAGKTYVLTRDVSGERTPVFLGKDVTLDLNGHTVTFAAGKYEHVPNYGFEDGLKHWDVSMAPGAEVVSSSIRPMVGERILQLKAGEEIVSPYINLPVADRSYDAMCAVATDKMRVTISVEDASGKPVKCIFTGGSQPRVSLPERNRSPKLGGGVIFGHMHHQPAGRYRLRITAETDCLIDECDIRPSLDAGVAIVGGVRPYASYYDMLKYYPCAFFDYGKPATRGEPVEGVHVVKGAGKITIRNGVIRNGTLGIRTLGVESNAKDVTVLLENVRILNAGINANAARISNATLRNCRFEVDTPFIINRHNTSEMNVRVDEATEVAGCEFIGGQGNFSGACPKIHDNLFVNGQTVTNHYSISPGSGTKVYRNRFEPKIGSGIYIGRSGGVEVYDNVFKISSAPPNCEYRYARYSTNAIRLSDYNAPADGPTDRRCAGNKVYRNKIHITGKSYPQYDRYEPRAYAFFVSVGGGTNYVYDNEITIDKVDDGNCRPMAFFIGGSNNGGEITNNKVVSNCPVAWIGNDYGNAGKAIFRGNTFTKAAGTPVKVRPFVLGDGGNKANGLAFYSNVFKGWDELFSYHSRSISYAFGWTLTVAIVDKAGKPIAATEVVITDPAGKEAFKGKTDARGVLAAHLPQYTYAAGRKTASGPYTVRSSQAEAKATLTQDTAIRLMVDRAAS